MSRHRLTEKKKAFARACVNGMNQTEAARVAGYSHPTVQGSQLMERDDRGRLVDRSLASYLEELSEGAVPDAAPEVAEKVAPEGARSRPAVATDDETLEVLTEIIRDPHEPGGTRIRAAELLMKHKGIDRPTGQQETDAATAFRKLKTALGID